jgi:hypothetical protein
VIIRCHDQSRQLCATIALCRKQIIERRRAKLNQAAARDIGNGRFRVLQPADKFGAHLAGVLGVAKNSPAFAANDNRFTRIVHHSLRMSRSVARDMDCRLEPVNKPEMTSHR